MVHVCVPNLSVFYSTHLLAGASDALSLAVSAVVAAAGLVGYKLLIRLRWHREQLSVKTGAPGDACTIARGAALMHNLHLCATFAMQTSWIG